MTKEAPNKDLRVSVTLGLTIPVETYGSIKPTISIIEIDPSGNVEEQVEAALNAASIGFAKIDENLESLLSELIAPITNTPSMKGKIESIDSDLTKVKNQISQIVDRVRQIGKGEVPSRVAQLVEQKENE